jgi:hypothetical protein|tara:strand:+ start:16 stop:324 length:309 start_codon:yes stop_codon:yes gene_type:complete
MSYSKKDLKDIKNKLKKENPSFFNNSSIKKQKKSIVKSQPSRKKIVKWNYKVNDVVTCIHSQRIGLIVSDNTYFGRKLEKNYYFVLFGCRVQKYDGSYLRAL